MRDRKKDKGVKVCPDVQMSEVAFLEPYEEDPELKANASKDVIEHCDSGDLEGSADPKIQQQLEDENM